MSFRIKMVRMLSLFCAAAFVIAIANPVVGDDSAFHLSLDAQEALYKLPVTADLEVSITYPQYIALDVDSDRTKPINQEAGLALGTEFPARAPFAATDNIILQFEPGASSHDIWNYVVTNDLDVVRVFPEIGAIQIKTDLSSYFEPDPANFTNLEVFRALSYAVANYESDSRIRSASLDVLLNGKEHAGCHVQMPSNDTAEVTDWGIHDIEANKVWHVAGAKKPVFVGIFDMGFSKHEDISFHDLSQNTASQGQSANHGNHVAAIACGKHNGLGVRGVLPNCSVQTRSVDLFMANANGNLGTALQFSQVIPTLIEFVTSEEDVKAFNISLGYNWQRNFRIDPELPEYADLRKVIQSQGLLMAAVLRMAKNSDKIIFSAAGNDSSTWDIRNAKFASPFNYAAVMARQEEIAWNGVVVEAHDERGRRANFSNSGGHISCPGVDIYSAWASDPDGRPSESNYCVESGTSMAAPYCAAGHLLFRLIRPGYSGVEAASCLQSSLASSSTGTPMLRLTQSAEMCPKRENR